MSNDVIEQEYYDSVIEQLEKTNQGNISEKNKDLDITNDIENILYANKKNADEKFNKEYLAMKADPYNRRIDIKEYHSPNPDTIYFGLRTIWDEDSNVIVCNWRNPIGELYQRIPGSYEYQSPQGKNTGEIILRKDFEIVAGKVTVKENFNNSYEEISRILEERHIDGHLKETIKSLTVKQGELIRNIDNILLIQGFAGSGKTLIALKRAAQLLYRWTYVSNSVSDYRNSNFSMRNILILSPNNIFAKYAMNIFPSLGEDRPEEIVFDEFVNGIVKSFKGMAAFDFYSRNNLLEYLTENETEYCMREKRYYKIKNSNDIKFKIDHYAFFFSEKIVRIIEDKFPENIKISFKNSEKNLFFRDQMIETCNTYFRALKKGKKSVSILNELIEAKNKYDDFFKKSMKEYNNQFLDLDSNEKKELENEKRKKTQEYDSGWTYLLSYMRGISLWDLYIGFWDFLSEDEKSKTYRNDAIVIKNDLFSLKDKYLKYEDVGPLMYIEIKFRGFDSRFNDIKHIVIDEIQDYMPLHIQIIRECLPRNCGMTLIGDVCQNLESELGFSDWINIEKLFYLENSLKNLSESFRNTPEIMKLANSIVGRKFSGDIFRNSSSNPDFIYVSSYAEEIRQLIEVHKFDSLAVICSSVSRCTYIHNLLPEFNLLGYGEDKFPEGFLILPVHLAKGLEFDNVIVIDVDKHTYKESNKNYLYTAVTRAARHLFLLSENDKSDLVDENLVNVIDRREVHGNGLQ